LTAGLFKIKKFPQTPWDSMPAQGEWLKTMERLKGWDISFAGNNKAMKKPAPPGHRRRGWKGRRPV
jgi:hypothetical protein